MTWSTMSQSKYGSTPDTTKLARFDRMLLGPCTDILRAILAIKMDPPVLSNKVRTFVANLKLRKNRFNPFEDTETIIYTEDYKMFDVSLICKIFRNICNITPHFKGWGNPPDPYDRSMSANIERIRIMRNDRGHYEKFGIPDDQYKILCTDIYTILSEFVTYLATVKHGLEKTIVFVDNHSEFLKSAEEIMDMSMDPEKEYELNIQNQNLEKDLKLVKKSRKTWIEPVESKQLREHFFSFTVEFDNCLNGCSFVRKIFENGFKQKLETEIKSLADGVSLTKISKRTDRLEPMDTAVYEVAVTSIDDKPCVTEEDKIEDFFGVSSARIILITSKHVYAVDAKLAVYKKYKEEIDAHQPILLHHEYEEFDEVAKLNAFKRLSSYCGFIESVRTFFEKDLVDWIEGTITQDTIAKCIQQSKEETDGSLKIERDWKKSVYQEIRRIISETEEPDCIGVLDEIKKRSNKTVEDLNSISNQLSEFLTRIGSVDPEKMIEALVKRELIDDDSVLRRNYPSFESYIVGYRGNNKIVKVFLCQEDKEFERFFEKSCKMSEKTTFEFVNINKKIKTNENDDERAQSATDNSIKIELDKIIGEYFEKFSTLYTTFTAMIIGNSRRKGDEIVHGPCIVLYCLDKTFIPVGEKPLPDSLKGWPCDIRKGYSYFGKSCGNCIFSKQNLPMPGCSIGMPYSGKTGSVGFLVEPKNPNDGFKCGFLTAAHVVLNSLNYEKSIDNHHPSSPYKTDYVVHPSYSDDQRNDIVGEVVESFCGNYGSTQTGIDLAVVKCSNCSHIGKKDILQVVKQEEQEHYLFNKVLKKGKTTGTTYGYLKDNNISLKVNIFNSYIMFHNCFAVSSNAEDKPFFEQGDSGAGVLVMDEDETYKPLGIAFAYLSELVAVCKIDEILDKLNLQVVRYHENTREVTEDTHELTEETEELIDKKPKELTEKTQDSTEKAQEPTETQ